MTYFRLLSGPLLLLYVGLIIDREIHANTSVVKDQRFKKLIHCCILSLMDYDFTVVSDCLNNNLVLVSESFDSKGVALSVFQKEGDLVRCARKL